MSGDYIKELEAGAGNALNFLEEEFSQIHTGRASVGLISEILVDVYGSKSPLKQVANITITDPKSMAVQPWDKGNVVQIESALRESNLGFGIVNTGDMIRVNIPELTAERRNQYIKLAKEKAEEAKISVRNARHEVWEKTKKAKSDGEITEDDMYRRESEINKFVEEKNKRIDDIFSAKERELGEV